VVDLTLQYGRNRASVSLKQDSTEDGQWLI